MGIWSTFESLKSNFFKGVGRHIFNFTVLPGVVVDDIIIRSDKGIIDYLQTRIDHSHSRQLQTINGVTLGGQSITQY